MGIFTKNPNRAAVVTNRGSPVDISELPQNSIRGQNWELPFKLLSTIIKNKSGSEAKTVYSTILTPADTRSGW